MHHALIEQELYNNEHGFFGVAVAIYLRKVLGAGRFTLDDILRCISATTPAEFGIDENLTWGDFSISAQQLLACREHFRFSIGSCSIHEPDADLVRLFGLPKSE
jgi:hypothetical protein